VAHLREPRLSCYILLDALFYFVKIARQEKKKQVYPVDRRAETDAGRVYALLINDNCSLPNNVISVDLPPASEKISVPGFVSSHYHYHYPVVHALYRLIVVRRPRPS